MLSHIVEASIRLKGLVIVLFCALLAIGVYAARTLPVDAVPDVSTIQVAVLTNAPGLSPIEVERTVTFPMEMALNGTPNLIELRSLSRPGLSSVTAIFKDGTDIYLARQLVSEKVRSVEESLPPAAGKPEMTPVSGGLGEIYLFVVRSEQHSPTQLRTMLDWEISPKLRQVPGVVEINNMGGDLKEYHVVVDPARLHAHRMTLNQVADALQRANTNVGGGYIERGKEALTLRGFGLLSNEEEIGNVVLRTDNDGTPVLVRNLGQVQVGAAMRFGIVTRDGEREAVTGFVLMLIGANSRDVVNAVKQRVVEIQSQLPPGVQIDPIYDRADFVERTLFTVIANLIEGALVVTIVLWLLLGTLRGALVVVLGIPGSMAVALVGMHLFGVTGDLMSLGAIDFGFLVDGPIVILEAIVAGTAGRQLLKSGRDTAYGQLATGVMRPVAYAMVIILLVYLPLMSLEGIEGKMFRPMALTMACALFGALIYSVVFFPALLVTFVPPSASHGPAWLGWLTRHYEHGLPKAIRLRWPLIGMATATLAGSIGLSTTLGADFLPRIEEGDMVVTIRRAPSIGIAEARRLDLETEKVLKKYPEVATAVGMTGRSEVAIDPMGLNEGDIMVHLRPRKTWTTAKDLDTLSEIFKNAIEQQVPGSFVSMSQPIEDRTNELISGSRADVQIAIFGDTLEQLRTSSEAVAEIVRKVPGTGDIRVERLLGSPELTVKPDRSRLARYGVKVEDALAVVRAARLGLPVGWIYEGQKRFELKLIAPPPTVSAEGVGQLFVEAKDGTVVPLSELATIEESEGPTQVRREGLQRTVRVDVNLRGRDLVSWVQEARREVDKVVKLPSGYSMTWGGQFENFQRAKARLMLVVPVALALIFGMLLWTFQNARYATAVFAAVPFAIIGGILGLATRTLSFSIPAAVGFIALAGVSVLNGVVLTTEVRRRLESGIDRETALVQGSTHTLRAVMTTGAVAALGFMPMALATGAGAEVQRPLATVVIAGIVVSTALTTLLLPGVLWILAPKYVPPEPPPPETL